MQNLSSQGPYRPPEDFTICYPAEEKPFTRGPYDIALIGSRLHMFGVLPSGATIFGKGHNCNNFNFQHKLTQYFHIIAIPSQSISGKYIECLDGNTQQLTHCGSYRFLVCYRRWYCLSLLVLEVHRGSSPWHSGNSVIWH
jgi:hypothetical protein